MNPPLWTDDELLRALRAALREPVADEGFIRAARAAAEPADDPPGV